MILSKSPQQGLQGGVHAWTLFVCGFLTHSKKDIEFLSIHELKILKLQFTSIYLT